MFSKYLAIAVAAMSLGLAACSDDSKEATHNIRAEPDLQGSFTDVCSSSKLADLSEKIRLNFEGNKFTRSQIFYSEADCKTESGRIEYTGSFKAGEQNKDDPKLGGTMDIDIQSVKITTASEGLAKALNIINYCSHNDFAAGKEVTISGKQTQGMCPLENVPTKLYTAYRLENDRLYLGSADITTMPTVETNRSSAILFEKTYVKD